MILEPLDDLARAHELAQHLGLIDWDLGSNPARRMMQVVVAIDGAFPGALRQQGDTWQFARHGLCGPIESTPRRAIEGWIEIVRALPPGSRIHLPAGDVA